MRNKSLFNLILYIIWCIWFILPLALSFVAGIMAFGMFFLPFIDDGDVGGYFRLLGTLVLFFTLVISKVILVIFQFISYKRGNTNNEIILSLVQLCLSIPLLLIMWLSQREIGIITRSDINPFYTFPIIIELILLIILGLNYFFSMSRNPQRICIVNFFIPGLGTILSGTKKYRVSSYIQLILFLMSVQVVFLYNLSFLINVVIIWIWSYYNTKNLLKESNGDNS